MGKLDKILSLSIGDKSQGREFKAILCVLHLPQETDIFLSMSTSFYVEVKNLISYSRTLGMTPQSVLQ